MNDVSEVFDIADFQRRYNIPYFIDFHVHMRDEEWFKKAKMRAVYDAGRKVGINLFADMPNLVRPVINAERVKERLNLAEEQGLSDVYRLYVGLTSDENQIKEAVALTNDDEFGSKIVGLKLFAGESTGDLAVIDENEQLKIYQTLVAEDYRGVVAVHCEKQDFIDGSKFDFENSGSSWAEARPGKAEYESVMDQINCVDNADFKGRLHILHVSYAETIDLIRDAVRDGFDITFELTPHHLLCSTEIMQNYMDWEMQLGFKCNPSIKDEKNRLKLNQFLMNLTPDDELYRRVCIGSDYAPHGVDKLKSPYPSGIANYSLYPTLIEQGISAGIDGQVFADLMYHNIVDIYGLDS